MRAYARHRHVYDAAFLCRCLRLFGINLVDLCRQNEMVVRLEGFGGAKKGLVFVRRLISG